MVWVHVTLATLSWLTVLWSVAAAGSLVPRAREVAAPALEPGVPAREPGVPVAQ